MAPDLTHFGSRITHRRRNAAEYNEAIWRGWIADPQNIKPGNHMATVRREVGRHAAAARLSGEPEMSSRRGRFDSEPSSTADEARSRAASWRHPARLFRLAFHHHAPGDRHALHRDGVRLSAARRHGSAADAHAAGARQQHVSGAGPLQPDLHHAWHDDDVSVRRAGDGRHGGLSGAADARNAQRGFSATERVRLLDVFVGRHFAVRGRRSRARCPDAGWFAYPPLSGPQYSPERAWISGRR